MDESAQLFFMPTRPNRTVPMTTNNHSQYRYPCESIYSFTENPVEFEEMVLDLAETAKQIYFWSQGLDRYNQLYMEFCVRLQDIIKKLGSCLITMEMLDQQGQDVTKMRKALCMETLVAYASFNFRKCYHTADGARSANVNYFLQAANMQFAWATILQRLEATKQRIGLIREGKIKFEYKGAAPKEKTADEKETETVEEAQTPLQPPAAFPVMKTALEGSAVKTAAPEPEEVKAAEEDARLQEEPAPAEEAVMPDEKSEAIDGTEKSEASDKAEAPRDVPEEDRLIGEPEHFNFDFDFGKSKTRKTWIPPGWGDQKPEDPFFDDWDFDKSLSYEEADKVLDLLLTKTDRMPPEAAQILYALDENRRSVGWNYR